jgi:hypothetical protein
LQVPSEQLDKVWEGYERFERSTAGRNHVASVRFIDEARPRLYAAREAWEVRRRLLKPLDRDALPWVVGHTPSSPRFVGQRRAWIALIEFEAANEQSVSAEVHHARLGLVFQQALQPLRACPEACSLLTSLARWPPANAWPGWRASRCALCPCVPVEAVPAPISWNMGFVHRSHDRGVEQNSTR